MHLLAAFALVASLSAPASSQSPGRQLAASQPRAAQAAPPQVPADVQRQLDWAVRRGRLLFALDRAAWVGTDDMRERVPEAQMGQVRGYIVDSDDQSLVTIFYAQEGDRLVTAYRGRVGPRGITSREIFPEGQRPELTARQQRLARALGQALAAAPRLRMCGPGNPNFAIVPPETPDGPLDVYVMTPQSDNNVLPLGGHHRITLGADGRVIAQRGFTNSCLNMPLSERGRPRPAALVVSHLLDPIPTEIHVFSALAARLPLYVTTRDTVWNVNGERIRLLERRVAPRR
jgi:hypothetical protein